MNFDENYNFLLNKLMQLDNLNKLELSDLLHLAKDIEMEYKNLNLVVKRNANSLYGVSASAFFSLKDVDIAEDITTVSKHFACIVDIGINKFFVNWGDTELKIIQEFYPNVIRLKQFDYVPNTRKDICVYGDTDSRYCDLEQIYDLLIIDDEGTSIKIPDSDKELSDFATFLVKRFINDVIKTVIETDCKKRNGRIGYLRMSHEVTTKKSIFYKRKKYILTQIWKDGKFLKEPKFKFQGVEIKKGSMSNKAKKILSKLIHKFLIDNMSVDDLRQECLKIYSYIKQKKEVDFIYQISSVSGLDDIKLVNDKYVSDKNHIQMQIALSWLNFIKQNDLTKDFFPPFEGQKMNFYYCNNSEFKVIGIPDDVKFKNVPNLPEPDWNKMINNVLLKPLLRYILEKETIEDEDCEYFLLGVKQFNFFK